MVGRTLLWGGAALLLLTSVAGAATIDDFTFSGTLWGDDYRPEELKGRVVLVDFWGVN